MVYKNGSMTDIANRKLLARGSHKKRKSSLWATYDAWFTRSRPVTGRPRESLKIFQAKIQLPQDDKEESGGRKNGPNIELSI